MKIILTLENSVNIGGGDYSIFKFAEYLAKKGNKITIFTNTENSYVKEIRKKGLVSFYFSGYIPTILKGMGFIGRMWDKIYTFLVIDPFIRKNKDIDFIIGCHTSSTIKANQLAKKFNIPSVSFVFETPEWMHSQLKERWIEEYRGRFKKLWIRTKKELETVDIILSNSDLTDQENKKWLHRDIQGTIYPGLDTNIVDKIKNVKKANQIIYIGRLNDYKNVDVLIKAISKIRNSPKLIICGDGEERQNLMDLAEKLKVNCEFKGRVSDNEKWVEIKKSLFMVFPTSFEGFGMPPMEALYCKIPCICTNIPILREVYQDKVEYFKENNVNDLVKKINFLLNNPSYGKKRAIEGRNYIKSKYSWKISAEKIEKILKDYKNEQ